MTFRKLRKSIIHWLVLGFLGLAMLICFILLIILAILEIEEKYENRYYEGNNTSLINQAIDLPIKNQFLISEELSDCSFIITSVTDDCVIIDGTYSFNTINYYEVDVRKYSIYKEIKVDGNVIDIAEIYTIEPGNHTLNYKIELEVDSTNILKVRYISNMNGKKVKFNGYMSPEVQNAYIEKDVDNDDYYIIQRIDFNEERVPENFSGLIITIIAIGSYIVLSIIFEITLAIGCGVEKRKNKKRLIQEINNIQNSEEEKIDI